MFFSNIMAYCKAHEITVKDFEVMCGLANGQVSKWDGEHLPSLASLQKVVAATGIPIEKWLNGKVED